nr:hypothetical protein [Tanacetum cinerariifolium]
MTKDQFKKMQEFIA